MRSPSARTAAAVLMGLAGVLSYAPGGCASDKPVGAAMEVGAATYSALDPSSGPSCVPNQPTKKCHDCLTKFDCGVPQFNTALGGNCDSGGSSFNLYANLFECVCGADAANGKCGAKCSKSCTGIGTDDATCPSCMGTAFNSSSCQVAYVACDADK